MLNTHTHAPPPPPSSPSAPLFVSHADILSLSPPTISTAPCILSHWTGLLHTHVWLCVTVLHTCTHARTHAHMLVFTHTYRKKRSTRRWYLQGKWMTFYFLCCSQSLFAVQHDSQPHATPAVLPRKVCSWTVASHCFCSFVNRNDDLVYCDDQFGMFCKPEWFDCFQHCLCDKRLIFALV